RATTHFAFSAFWRDDYFRDYLGVWPSVYFPLSGGIYHWKGTGTVGLTPSNRPHNHLLDRIGCAPDHFWVYGSNSLSFYVDFQYCNQCNDVTYRPCGGPEN